MTIGDAFGPGERQPQLRGVSGWLLFLCIVLMVFLPIRVALFIWALITSPASLGELQFLVVALILVPSAVGITAGVLLYRENRLGVRLAQLYFAFQLLLAALALVGDPSSVGESLFVFVPGAAWLAYLFVSERVRNTYAKDTARDAAEVFK
jgi:hypothetical protein